MHEPASGQRSTVPRLLPSDEYNQALEALVHPAGWQNPTPTGRYNLVVIGAGTAGLVCAAGAAGLGARVALIERHWMGGDCLIHGCMPSKTLIRCARAVHEVRQAEAFGVRIGGPVEVDFPAVLERMRRLRAQIAPHDSAERFRSLGVDVYLGTARFTGSDTVEVDGQTLRFSRAVIATGSRPAMLDLPSLESLVPLTSETIFSLPSLPRRLAVIGAGPIGCELGQAFRRFGSAVDLLDVGPTILARDEPEAADVVRQQLEREGVRLRLSVQILGGEVADGQKFLLVEQEGRLERFPLDAVLIAIGRRPNVEGLGLEAAGVAHDTSGVRVDDFLRTTNRRIYAAGDVCTAFRFTHAADAQARIVIRNALFFGRARMSRLVIPWCTFTDPEVAHVGLTTAEARRQNMAIQTFRVPLASIDRARLDGDTGGFVLIHVRQGSDRIVGATVVAAHAGEMIGEVVLAVGQRLGLAALSGTIHPYPTVAAAIQRAGDAYQKTRLTPWLAWLLRTLLAWRR